MPQPAKRIAILGLGLIGSSLARALAAKHPEIHIAGFDMSHTALTLGAQKQFIHSQHAHAGQAANDADIIVLATPLPSFPSLAADIKPFLKKGAVVTDVGSVKRLAMSSIIPHLPKEVAYVPGHPIAGSEQTGAAAGRADLFTGKRVILTPAESELKSEAVGVVRKLWEDVGARIDFMPADLHDRIYAYVSHLAQLIAFAAQPAMREVPMPQDEASLRFCRLMKSDPELWADICFANADYIGQALSDFAGFASQMESELSETPATGGADANLAAQLFPKIVATCLIATASLLQELTGVHPARYAGSGFTDMTAPAISDPEAALAGISSHHWVIAKMLGTMLKNIRAMQEALEHYDRKALLSAIGA